MDTIFTSRHFYRLEIGHDTISGWTRTWAGLSVPTARLIYPSVGNYTPVRKFLSSKFTD